MSVSAQSRLPDQPGAGLLAATTRTLGAIPPHGLIVLAILSIQVGAALAIQLFDSLGPGGTVALRVTLSAILLWLAWRPALDANLRRHLGLILLYGLTLAGMNLLFYLSIDRIPLGIAVAIEFTGPLAVAVATSRRLRDFLWIGLAVVGVLLLAPDIGSDLDPLGVLYAALAGVGWGGFVLLSVRVGKAFKAGDGLALGMAVAAIALLPFSLPTVPTLVADPLLLAAALGIAILSTAIPFSLEFEALKRIPPRVYGVLITLEPAIAMAVGLVLLGEVLGPRALAAVACVTAAALGISLANRGRGSV